MASDAVGVDRLQALRAWPRLFAAAEVEAPGTAPWRSFPRSPASRALRSTAASTTLARGRYRTPDTRKGGGGKPLSKAIRRWPATFSIWLSRRRWLAHAPLLWVSRSREAGASARGDGACDQRQHGGKLLTTELCFSRQHNRKADECSKHPYRDAQFCVYITRKSLRHRPNAAGASSVDTQQKLRQLQERRQRLSSEGLSAPRQRARLRAQEVAQGGAVRRPRRDRQRRRRQCRHYRGHCRSLPLSGDPLLAASDMGIANRYPQAREFTITADCGGSNGARVRLCGSRAAKARRRGGASVLHTSTTIRPQYRSQEQDLAPPVLPHHPELACTTVHRSALPSSS